MGARDLCSANVRSARGRRCEGRAKQFAWVVLGVCVLGWERLSCLGGVLLVSISVGGFLGGEWGASQCSVRHRVPLRSSSMLTALIFRWRFCLWKGLGAPSISGRGSAETDPRGGGNGVLPTGTGLAKECRWSGCSGWVAPVKPSGPKTTWEKSPCRGEKALPPTLRSTRCTARPWGEIDGVCQFLAVWANNVC